MVRAGQQGTSRAMERLLAAIPMPWPHDGQADVPHQPGAQVSRPGPGMAEGLAIPAEGHPFLFLHVVESLA